MNTPDPLSDEQQKPMEKFDAFVNTHPEQSKNLQLPDETLDAFICDRIKEIASNGQNLEITRVNRNSSELSIIIVEHSYPQLLTDANIWEQWLSDIKTAKERQKDEIIKVLPKAPDEINRLHAKFRSEIESGRFCLTDRILMTITLRTFPESPLALYVGDYDGESHQGIGTDFYLKTLPDLAKKLGFRFITGLNDPKNISFYTKNLGRYLITEIKPEYQKQLFPNAQPTDPDFSTIQFLYPEDTKKFVTNPHGKP